LYADFNGLPEGAERTDFYEHEANWSNRMILGDSLHVMASLAEREGLRGQVQCIYIDPPYGIKFNSNFQWSTTNRDVRDGNATHITREPEQVRAFRDTWRDGLHSYLTYLRDRLTVARELLTESGSIFVQIGDENVHRLRALMDEVYGVENFVSIIATKTSGGSTGTFLPGAVGFILWYAKRIHSSKFNAQYRPKDIGAREARKYNKIRMSDLSSVNLNQQTDATITAPLGRIFRQDNLTSQSIGRAKGKGAASWFAVNIHGKQVTPSTSVRWKTNRKGMDRLLLANRVEATGNSLAYVRYLDDFQAVEVNNLWDDVGGVQSRSDPKVYVVQTPTTLVHRCMLMATDPGDLVLDPTCGSGTTAYAAEQWGRRWITIDTSRVALALARARIMGARYPYYLLADSTDGQAKLAEVERREPSSALTYGDIRQGFVYERVPHITLRDIVNNAEIDVIWERMQPAVEDALADLNQALREESPAPFTSPTGGREGQQIDFSAPDGATVTLPSGESVPANCLLEWEVPREPPSDWPAAAEEALDRFWDARIARQREIDASIAAKAEFEYLYDKPYEDRRTVRVAGPFTVESLSPHRILGVDEHGELIDTAAEATGRYGEPQDFATMILDNLRMAGVQQAHKEDRISFDSLTPWPGVHVCAEGRYSEGSESGRQRRAGVFVGPEFGTVQRQDLVEAAREAAEAGFDVLVACAFNYEAHATEFDKLGRIPVLKARMNADLHMGGELKNTGQGNLFVIFGEPDIVVASEEWLVDSSERRVAPYAIFKLVSGVDRLAEVNRLSRHDLQAYAQLSRRRAIWDYLADQASRVLGSSEYRGGTGQTDDRGVSSVAWHCAGLASGIGDLSDLVQKAGTTAVRAFSELVERLRRDQPDAEWADQVTFHSPLTTRSWAQVRVNGVDVFDPSSGEVRSDDTDGIACWFIDTDYDSESFFVRHAYFLGANDPYKSLKTTLKAEIDVEAWATLHSDISRPFPKPESGRIAVKVINHLGDEVMKVFRVE